jgi:hypothetical protein
MKTKWSSFQDDGSTKATIGEEFLEQIRGHITVQCYQCVGFRNGKISIQVCK